jgi:murein DD-endopeptidase MepM/ murein hydrolase activator NlpD
MTFVNRRYLYLNIIFIFSINFVFAADASIAFYPEKIVQGEPVQIYFGLPSKDIKPAYFDDQKLHPYDLITSKSKSRTIFGIDLKYKTGTSTIKLISKTGKIFTKDVYVNEREIPKLQFDIPQEFGGNTTQGQNNVTTKLSDDNKILSDLWSNSKKLWTGAFAWPVKNIFVTDDYGYSRSTGDLLVTHKGTDFRASKGTPIYAMNRGVVRLATKMDIYGNTVVIDHGQGLMTMYMHMDSLKAKQGYIINKGDLVGYAGATGYSEGDHLHLTVRVNGVSINPEGFMDLVGQSK